MKALVAAIAVCLLPVATQAMVFADTRVLCLAEFEARGISIEAAPALGQTDIYFVRITIRGGDPDVVFQSMEMDVAERNIDSDFTSTDVKKTGIRDSKRWAKIVRNLSTRTNSMSFSIARDEVPRSYIKFNYHLPDRDGIAVFGWFYCLLSDVIHNAEQSPQTRSEGSITQP